MVIPKSPAPVPMRLSQNIRNGFQVHCSIELTRRSRIEVPRVDYEKLSGDRVGESSESIHARVQDARDIQRNRFGVRSLQTSEQQSLETLHSVISNADMRVGEIRQFRRLPDEGQSLMQAATCTALCHRTRSVKLARTIADLARSEEIQSVHLAEALQYWFR
jgi:magnesium chelatase family protein